MSTSNDWFELLDPHEGLLCRMRTNDEPLRCGAKAVYLHHWDATGAKGIRHHASSLCKRHAESSAIALHVQLPKSFDPVVTVECQSGVMTGAQAVAAMTGSQKSTSERIAEELVMYIKQQEALTRQIEVGIERCRTMLRILNESNERKYQ